MTKRKRNRRGNTNEQREAQTQRRTLPFFQARSNLRLVCGVFFGFFRSLRPNRLIFVAHLGEA